MKTNLKKPHPFLAATLLCSLYGAPAWGAEVLYVCDKGEPYVQVLVDDSQPAKVTLLLGPEQLDVSQKPSPDSSLRYELSLGGNIWQIFNDHGSVSMALNDNPVRKCQKDGATTAVKPATVSEFGNFSFGGKVHSGPGMHHKKLDSLAYGEPVVLLEHTGEMMDGYEWFKIEFGEGAQGYQWGGIMCSKSLHIIGLFNPCPDDMK